MEDLTPLNADCDALSHASLQLAEELADFSGKIAEIREEFIESRFPKSEILSTLNSLRFWKNHRP